MSSKNGNKKPAAAAVAPAAGDTEIEHEGVAAAEAGHVVPASGTVVAEASKRARDRGPIVVVELTKDEAKAIKILAIKHETTPGKLLQTYAKQLLAANPV
jgi:hypothetical protein